MELEPQAAIRVLSCHYSAVVDIGGQAVPAAASFNAAGYQFSSQLWFAATD
jgi:hypothetical protein